ncbi:MAG TPA: DUF2726 domain-containing protein [Pyrinomonadaceae bacterium]|jgi:hypothetical protein
MSDNSEIDVIKKDFDFTEELWSDLWNYIRLNPEFVRGNAAIKQAIFDYEIFFFSKSHDELDKEYLLQNFETFYTLHKRKTHILSENRFNLLIRKMAEIWKDIDLRKAYTLAINNVDDEVCKDIIIEYQNSLPKQVLHSQSKVIQVTENKSISFSDGRRSLFKSAQEKEFFDAVRDVYPQFIVYPNVAVSSIIDFEIVEPHLSSAEKKYFFTAIIDCVVFDYQQLYLPKYFFELDSAYHDDSIQQMKDEYKNNILSAAGQKLYRLRRINNNQKRVDFISLIRELLKSSE